jgi:N-acetylneuraminic acid mutarotase
MKRELFTKSGFFNLRALIGLLLCAATAGLTSGGTLLALSQHEVPGSAQRTLTLEERVSYQRAIEEVYWRHRIWPKERPDPKPSLDAVISQAQIEKKVRNYLRNSQALADYSQRPFTTEQLQAEMDRMAQNTRQSEVLQELFEALGNDPFVIAECLARPILAERLLAHPAVERVKQQNRTFDQTVAGVKYTLPTISEPSGGCVEDTWTPTNLTGAPDGRALHTAVWTGSEMIVWGGDSCLVGCEENTGGRYNPSTDSWTATSTTNAPDGRHSHTAVWTGTDMIVWGGVSLFIGILNTGGRYNPATDGWVATSTVNTPEGRYRHTAIWTGSNMIVWGGVGANDLNTGGRYNPANDSWIPTSTTNAPDGRVSHTAVWTGSEMIVWGGGGFDVFFNTGGKYNPITDSWIATSTTNAPDARQNHTAIWTGSNMIVWGGGTFDVFFNTGGKYDPITDSWTATTTDNSPDARTFHTAVWTGSNMIVWGGYNSDFFNSGGRYDPDIDHWVATSTANAADARWLHTAVWTGSEMVVWGGIGVSSPPPINTGGRYCVPSGCTVTSTTCGRIIVGTAPTDFTVNLSNPADPATVQASDFTVNGAPADNDIIINGDLSITFHFNISPVVGGQNTMHIPAGAFNCGPVQEFACTFFYRVPGATPPPRPRPTPHIRPTPP